MNAPPSPSAAPRVLLAGGGSGGHVFPALAVGDELARRGWRADFAGAAGKMEERLVGERGLPFHPLPARALVGRGLVGKAAALWTLVRSTFAARSLVRRLGAEVVVGTGGYVSAPAVLGAALAAVPTLLVEPNARAGLANRALSRFAREAAVAFERTKDDLRCPSTVTGVPVRAAFAGLPEVAADGSAELGVLVLGGSQGSLQLNRSVPAALALLLAEAPPAERPVPVTLLHQAGRGKVEDTVAAYREAGVPVAAPGEAGRGEHGAAETPVPGRFRARVVDFIDDVPAEIGAAHLVISRAGAITSAEICAAGRASLLVPLVVAAGGHQVDNARALAEAGASVMVAGRPGEPADESIAPRLADELGPLLAAPDRLATMGRSARTVGRPGAAAAIADRVEHLAGREPARKGGQDR